MAAAVDYQHSNAVDNVKVKMMAYERPVDDAVMPSPGSPPGMTASKSSKSSSFHSLSSDDSSVLADASHFEDIGLDDDAIHLDRHSQIKSAPNPYSPSYSSDLRAASLKHASTPRVHTSSRDLSKNRALSAQRDITSAPKYRPPFPSLKAQVRSANVRSTSTNQLLSETYISPMSARPLASRSSSSLSLNRRRRSPSPNLSLTPKDPNMLVKPRRSSWQSNRERKTVIELEHECDEDDGDDIPDGLILDNVPISPRPPQERAKSQPASTSVSPDRAPKERVRSVGNGTPAVAVAQGSLRSPTWKSDIVVPTTRSALSSGAPSPLKMRAKSWTAALAELSAEAKDLTTKLEEHADELDIKAQRSSTGSMPVARRSSDYYESKSRHKSALAELPPLRRTNIMIDPLPISKEKEAVLSRTRPSWLPPKDPAEERRHLREYQKMMAHSAEADRRREAAKRAMSECRDVAADSIMAIWENDIVPRWNDAIREKRTRELWWRGIAPRSRGVVWSKAIGNELGLSETSYKAALARAHESTERVAAGNGTVEDTKHAAWFDQIRKEVEEETWRDLRIFQKGGPLSQALVDVLSAYAMYRSDIGYVTGCNTIAALLLLNLSSPATAFVALANILNRPLPLSFYASDPGAKASAYNLLLQTLSHKSAALHDHLMNLPEHDPDAYFADIFTSLFTRQLALDEAARLWDVYVFEGDSVLVRAAVALLMQKEMALLGANTVSEVQSVLHGTAEEEDKKNQQRVVGGQGAEDRWIRAVREAGKA